MTITLVSHHATTPTPIALPAFRACAALEGSLSDESNQACASAMFEAFMASFAAEIAYTVTAAKSGKGGKLVKPTDAKITALRQIIADGFTKKSGFRLYGPDTNALGKPALPFLSITQVNPLLILIEAAVPTDHPQTASFAQTADLALRLGNMMAGYQGFGFFKSPISGLQDRYLPDASARFRTAIMNEWMSNPACTQWSKVWEQNKGAYQAGITELGWRTYVGNIFTDRITGTPAPTLTVEDLPKMKVVTAGPAPIWGDVNADEDITAYKDAYAYLAPAFTSRDMLRRSTLGGIPSFDPGRADVVDGYLDRFL